MQGERKLRPAPLEELNEGEVTEARPASSAIVMRDAGDGPEVLLVRRNPDARFMGGAWVFPGGGVKPTDASPAATARRELEEEANLTLASDDELAAFSRWITPVAVKVRFDTWFFLTRAPAGAEGAPDGSETVALRWLRPADALEAGRRGELQLVFPTIKHLEELAMLGSVADGLGQARSREVNAILPRVVGAGSETRVLLPGDAGYED
ncbi:MAG: NUDIX hydrolase [Thermoleophilaceae bacterium]|jgi:8-oxo-dGTP pyrophosphatase MutT (NUDIX family)|nr:NUDIX hydrolase [Thermoleophilaceae bacterium]MDQ3240389.1 NUDIX hydrolase [Actinomycetota bacterium]MDQ3318996.1 NUDIX hydrolase [Actinomycetota bacterium]MDQ3357127.1 NUDIX hydrolase [Actinomycetota bacterium]